MDRQIGTLRCRYRLIGDQGGSLLTRRLDRLAEDRLGDQVMAHLDEAFTGDEVYVVRRAEMSQVLDGRFPEDGPLVRVWAAGLARSISTAVVRDRSNGSIVVTFPSTADFVAAFVVDLMEGRAWDHWYYGPFRRHRKQPPDQAAVSALLAYDGELTEVLAVVARRGKLESLLHFIDPADLGFAPDHRTRPDADRPEEQGQGDEPADGSAIADDRAGAGRSSVVEWRPLVAVALAIHARLAPATDSLSLQAAVDRWLTTAPAASDWQDVEALTDAVAAIIVWLPGSLDLATVGRDEIAAAAVAVADWLDHDRLAAGLSTVGTDLGESPRSSGWSPGQQGAGGSVGPTGRRRAMVAAVERAWIERHSQLDRSSPRSAANLARMLTAVAVVEPSWAGDDAMRRLVTLLLDGWAEIRLPAAPPVSPAKPVAGTPGWHRPGRSAAGPSLAKPSTVDRSTRPVLERLGVYGDRALELVMAMATAGDAPESSAGGSVASEAAGIMLLARGLHDTRLGGLAKMHGYPPEGPNPLLTSLAWRWAGPAAMVDGRPDPAVVAVAGGEPIGIDGLRSTWSAVPDADHQQWLSKMSDLLDIEPAGDDGPFAHARIDLATADAVHDATAAGLVRAWARWLRGFEASSLGFVLDGFIRRPGELRIDADEIRVRMARKPLDTVLEIAGYLRPIEAVPGLPERRIVYELTEDR